MIQSLSSLAHHCWTRGLSCSWLSLSPQPGPGQAPYPYPTISPTSTFPPHCCPTLALVTPHALGLVLGNGPAPEGKLSLWEWQFSELPPCGPAAGGEGETPWDPGHWGGWWNWPGSSPAASSSLFRECCQQRAGTWHIHSPGDLPQEDAVGHDSSFCSYYVSTYIIVLTLPFSPQSLKYLLSSTSQKKECRKLQRWYPEGGLHKMCVANNLVWVR